MLFFNLKVLKEKLTNFLGIMPHLKLSKTYAFRHKEIEKQTKIATHMELWKYGQILTIQKFPKYQTIKGFK